MTKQSFDEWMAEVDSAIENEVYMISDDLPDVDYWDMWDNGLTPFEAADFAIQAAKDY